MQLLLIFILILGTAALTGLAVFLATRTQRRTPGVAELLQSVQQSQQQQLQTILQQLGRQQQSQEHSSGQLHQQLTSATQAVASLQTKLAQLEEGNKRILDLGKGITELQNILQAPKLRGNRGEIWLEELIAQIIPKDRYTMQYHFKSGEICDAAILLRDGLILPIDSKFSLENFTKMIQSEEEAERTQHEKTFVTDLKKRTDEIAKKYIRPDEGTLGFAFMYIPAENVYYQAFIEDTGNHQLLRYAFDRHVIPVSPNSLYAYLEVVLFGLRGLEIEESAKHMQQNLTSLSSEVGKFQDVYTKVGTNLRLAQQNFELGDKRLTRVQTKLTTLTAKEEVDLLDEPLIVPEEPH